MKKLWKVFGIGASLAIVSISGAVVVSAATATAPAPAIQGSQLAVVVNGDTVTGSAVGGAKTGPNATCAQTNFFKVGGTIVWRVWGTDVVGGGYSLTPANVNTAVLNIPPATKGGAEIQLPLTYVGEPYTAPPSQQIGYWEAHWVVPPGYPLGVINFNVQIKTKKTHVFPTFTGTWSQAHLASNSQLQVTT